MLKAQPAIVFNQKAILERLHNSGWLSSNEAHQNEAFHVETAIKRVCPPCNPQVTMPNYSSLGQKSVATIPFNFVSGEWFVLMAESHFLYITFEGACQRQLNLHTWSWCVSLRIFSWFQRASGVEHLILFASCRSLKCWIWRPYFQTSAFCRVNLNVGPAPSDELLQMGMKRL